MTIVARGAALYAATVGLEARPAEPVAPKGLVVRVEYPAVTADTEPFAVGRFLPEKGEAMPIGVRIVREDGGFDSGVAEVSEEGAFVIQLLLERHRQNRSSPPSSSRLSLSEAITSRAFRASWTLLWRRWSAGFSFG